MLKISIFADYRFVSDTTPTGVSKHMHSMVRGLWEDGRFGVSAVAASDQVECMGQLSFLPTKAMPLSFKVSRELWSRINYPPIERWCGAVDWVYCPNHDLIACRKVKYAVTFHGAPELDPGFHWERNCYHRFVSQRKHQQYRKIVERADRVLVVSQWLKNHMAEHFQVPEERMAVVGNGVSPVFFEAGKRRLQGAQPPPATERAPFVLVVGGLNYVDGGDYVVKLAQVLQRAGAPFRIKVAGSHNDADWAGAALATGVVDLLGHVAEEEIVELMSIAALLYMPSRYESFGMTAVEAMAAGCPVVVSRATALPEVVGDCGVYVDPEKAADVFDCIKNIFENKNDYHDLRMRAYQRASELYTWDVCKAQLVGLLTQA